MVRKKAPPVFTISQHENVEQTKFGPLCRCHFAPLEVIPTFFPLLSAVYATHFSVFIFLICCFFSGSVFGKRRSIFAVCIRCIISKAAFYAYATRRFHLIQIVRAFQALRLLGRGTDERYPLSNEPMFFTCWWRFVCYSFVVWLHFVLELHICHRHPQRKGKGPNCHKKTPIALKSAHILKRLRRRPSNVNTAIDGLRRRRC